MNLQMAHESYPLRTVSRLTGLSADVIRAWERRYGVVKPMRGPRGARLYTAADVTLLRLLQRVMENGRAIGDVARLSRAELFKLAEHDGNSGLIEAADPQRDDEIIEQALRAVKRFDLDNLERRLGDALVALGSKEFVRSLAAPLLQEVGDRWEDGRISIAEEHFVAGVLRNLLAALLRSRSSSQGGAVLLTTPPGERHELGILLAALMIADASFKLYYLGLELPPEEVVEAARRSNALAVGIGLVNGHNRDRASTDVRILEEALPLETEIWLGGREAPQVAVALGTTRAIVIRDLHSMESELQRLRSRATAGLI